MTVILPLPKTQKWLQQVIATTATCFTTCPLHPFSNTTESWMTSTLHIFHQFTLTIIHSLLSPHFPCLHPSMCSHSFLCVFNRSSNIIHHHNSTAANFQTRSTSNPCCNITIASAMSPWPVLSGLTASILILDFQPESRLSS